MKYLAALLFTLLFSTQSFADGKLLDGSFITKFCSAWNTSKLPQALGKSGTDWVNCCDGKGTQIMVMGRRDCKDWPKARLTIKANAQGNAMCVDSGILKEGKKLDWKFEPTTEQWADFSDGFGMMKMPGIMDGFVGSYPTAMNNIGKFEVFFALVGDLALKEKVDWACDGADMEDVNEEVEDIDIEDMKEILKK